MISEERFEELLELAMEGKIKVRDAFLVAINESLEIERSKNQQTPELQESTKAGFLKSINSEKSYYNSNGDAVVIFSLAHSDSKFTVEQNLILKSIDSKWIAEMPMLEFPKQKTVTAAAWKLADWMEKMASVIKVINFDSININNL